jgi:hypothetical protein
MDPADYPEATRAGWEAKANSAREGLPSLKAEYREALQQQSVAVFVVDGRYSGRFVELAIQEGVELSADASQFYKKLARRVWTTMGGSKEFTSDQYGTLIRGLVSEARALGFKDVTISTSQPFTSFQVTSEQAVVKYVRATVRRLTGDRINNELIARAITAAALDSKEGPGDGPVAVLVYGLASEEEARAAQQAWSCPTSRIADPEKEPTADDVLAFFPRPTTDSQRAAETPKGEVSEKEKQEEETGRE